MLALVRAPDEGLTVGQLVEQVDEPIDILRTACAILVRDKRIEVERKEPPEDSVVTLTDCEANSMMIRLLAAAMRRQEQKKAKKRGS
jgi:hypothetical protein